MKISLIVVGLGGILTLLFLSLDKYVSVSSRFLEIFDLKNLNTWFDNYLEANKATYNDFLNEAENIVDSLTRKLSNFKITKEDLLTFFYNLLNILYTILLYVLNVGLNVFVVMFIYIRESIHGENLKVKTSIPARIYMAIRRFICFIFRKLKQFLKYLLKLIKKQKRKIALAILLITIANAFLYELIVELVIFIAAYIYHSLNLEAFIVIESMLKCLITWLYPILIKIPKSVWIMLFYIILFLLGLGRAKYKLRKNHERIKEFAKNELTQTTFINGAPGTGKTLLNVSLSLISEENYIEELEQKLRDYEANHRYLNFALIRQNPQNYPMHQEYTDIYKMLNDRGTYLIANYSIYSPYFKEYSKIFNFDYMRKNKKANEYPLEEYIVISLSEIDKEYNSHDNMKDVGEDGAHTFFSTVSHDLKRHCKIFCDYQLKDQVPLRIRGNAEYFINVRKRKEKMPLILSLYYLPFKGLKKLIDKLIRIYELRKEKVAKKTQRISKGIYKRNNINLCYILLRNLYTTLAKICKWFESFKFFRLSTIISQEGDEKGKPKKLNINLCDLSIENQRLYDSTFLSYAYEQKKNMEFKNIESFTSLTPSIDELDKCNSRFYNKINN